MGGVASVRARDLMGTGSDCGWRVAELAVRHPRAYLREGAEAAIAEGAAGPGREADVARWSGRCTARVRDRGRAGGAAGPDRERGRGTGDLGRGRVPQLVRADVGEGADDARLAVEVELSTQHPGRGAEVDRPRRGRLLVEVPRGAVDEDRE